MIIDARRVRRFAERSRASYRSICYYHCRGVRQFGVHATRGWCSKANIYFCPSGYLLLDSLASKYCTYIRILSGRLEKNRESTMPVKGVFLPSVRQIFHATVTFGHVRRDSAWHR